MKISIIVAIGKNNQIGLNGTLPWKLKDDLKKFKELTTEHSILMGRKTFNSIGRALPNRINIVVSRYLEQTSNEQNINIFKSIEDGINFARSNREKELFIIGGSEIYKYCLGKELVDNLYLSFVEYDEDADVYFPNINYDNWRILEKIKFEKNENNDYNFEFTKFIKNNYFLTFILNLAKNYLKIRFT